MDSCFLLSKGFLVLNDPPELNAGVEFPPVFSFPFYMTYEFVIRGFESLAEIPDFVYQVDKLLLPKSSTHVIGNPDSRPRIRATSLMDLLSTR